MPEGRFKMGRGVYSPLQLNVSELKFLTEKYVDIPGGSTTLGPIDVKLIKLMIAKVNLH